MPGIVPKATSLLQSKFLVILQLIQRRVTMNILYFVLRFFAFKILV
jgi:hypothetical protein